MYVKAMSVGKSHSVMKPRTSDCRRRCEWGGELAGEEAGKEEDEGGEGEQAAGDGGDVAHVEDVAGVDADGRALWCGRDELPFLVVELGEGVDADAHADGAKGPGEEEGEQARDTQRGVGGMVSVEHGW